MHVPDFLVHTIHASQGSQSQKPTCHLFPSTGIKGVVHASKMVTDFRWRRACSAKHHPRCHTFESECHYYALSRQSGASIGPKVTWDPIVSSFLCPIDRPHYLLIQAFWTAQNSILCLEWRIEPFEVSWKLIHRVPRSGQVTALHCSHLWDRLETSTKFK